MIKKITYIYNMYGISDILQLFGLPVFYILSMEYLKPSVLSNWSILSDYSRHQLPFPMFMLCNCVIYSTTNCKNIYLEFLEKQYQRV